MMQLRLHDALSDIDAPHWDALRPDGNPFVSHAFLSGLEAHGCLRADYGWQAQHLALYEGTRLVAAAPLYVKGNSHGEFVFDWAWAQAYARHGLAYYPKLLCAVPYSPVPGPRLLAGSGGDASGRQRLLRDTLIEVAHSLGVSSVHVNFAREEDAAAFDGSDGATALGAIGGFLAALAVARVAIGLLPGLMPAPQLISTTSRATFPLEQDHD